MAQFFSLLPLSPIEYALVKLALIVLWVVGIPVLLILQRIIAAEPVKPKPFGTLRQRMHFWLILFLGGYYVFIIPFLRMKPDPEECGNQLSKAA